MKSLLTFSLLLALSSASPTSGAPTRSLTLQNITYFNSAVNTQTVNLSSNLRLPTLTWKHATPDSVVTYGDPFPTTWPAVSQFHTTLWSFDFLLSAQGGGSRRGDARPPPGWTPQKPKLRLKQVCASISLSGRTTLAPGLVGENSAVVDGPFANRHTDTRLIMGNSTFTQGFEVCFDIADAVATSLCKGEQKRQFPIGINQNLAVKVAPGVGNEVEGRGEVVISGEKASFGFVPVWAEC